MEKNRVFDSASHRPPTGRWRPMVTVKATRIPGARFPAGFFQDYTRHLELSRRGGRKCGTRKAPGPYPNKRRTAVLSDFGVYPATGRLPASALATNTNRATWKVRPSAAGVNRGATKRRYRPRRVPLLPRGNNALLHVDAVRTGTQNSRASFRLREPRLEVPPARPLFLLTPAL